MTDVEQGRRAILVTGAAGFIGSALCHRLHALGRPVIGYDNLSRGRAEYLPPAIRLIEGDIRDAARLTGTMAAVEPECVVHLAAMHFIPDCIARPRDTLDVNVEGTKRVLEACRTGAVRRVVFASSAAVYAPTDHPSVEDVTPVAPLEVYGESKVAGEELVRAFHAETGIAASILRMTNAIGRHETNPHVVPHIFESLQKSNVIALGNTAPARDYIDTRDLAAAIVAVADDVDGIGVFNVGSGVTHSVAGVVDALGRLLGRPIEIVQEASRVRATERMLLAVDTTRIRRATGWSAQLTLEDALADLVAAYGLRTAPVPTAEPFSATSPRLPRGAERRAGE